MPRRPQDLPADINGAGFSVSAARTIGVTPSRLRASDLTAPHRGVRTVGMPVSTHERARAFLPLLREGDRFSHVTAAELLGMRVPRRLRGDTLHVSARAPRRAPQVSGVVGHQSLRSATHVVEGMPVSPPVIAWIESATLMNLDELIIMGDGLVRRRGPMATMDEVTAAVEDHRGRRGHRRLAAALTMMRPGTDSARETELRLLIVRADLPEPEVNGVIRNRFGAAIAHGDLVFRTHRLLVEYDGRGHLEERQFAIDIRRLNEIGEERWRVIRVDKTLFSQRPEITRLIGTALAEGPVNLADGPVN